MAGRYRRAQYVTRQYLESTARSSLPHGAVQVAGQGYMADNVAVLARTLDRNFRHLFDLQMQLAQALGQAASHRGPSCLTPSIGRHHQNFNFPCLVLDQLEGTDPMDVAQYIDYGQGVHYGAIGPYHEIGLATLHLTQDFQAPAGAIGFGTAPYHVAGAIA